MKTYIEVWKFEDAPDHLKELSINGGDEDWLAVVPNWLADQNPGWLEPGTPFGCFDVSQYPHPTTRGLTVYIGFHS